MECLRLRVKDVDFDQVHIIVRDGNGRKDRATVLPASSDRTAPSPGRARASPSTMPTCARDRPGVPAVRPGREIPDTPTDNSAGNTCSLQPAGRRPAHRDHPPAPPGRVRRAEGRQGGDPRRRIVKTPVVIRSAQLRDPSPRVRPRYPHHPGTARHKDVRTTMIDTHVLSSARPACKARSTSPESL